MCAFVFYPVIRLMLRIGMCMCVYVYVKVMCGCVHQCDQENVNRSVYLCMSVWSWCGEGPLGNKLYETSVHSREMFRSLRLRDML